MAGQYEISAEQERNQALLPPSVPRRTPGEGLIALCMTNHEMVLKMATQLDEARLEIARLEDLVERLTIDLNLKENNNA